MSDVQPSSKVLSAATQGAAVTFKKNNIDPETIFRRVGLDMDSIQNPISEISLRQYCELFQCAASQSGNENIGLQFGSSFLPKHLGMLGFAAISSPTLGSALNNMIRYFPAHQEQTNFSVFQEDELLWLSYKILDDRIIDRNQDAELSLCMFTNIFREALGSKWSPLEIRFEHQSIGDSNEHEKVFGAPILFGRRTNAIAFRKEELGAIMPDQNPFLFTMVEAFLKNRMNSSHNFTEFADLVRNEIKLRLGTKVPSLESMADVLGISTNSFQKKLKDHGLNFVDLVRATRKELAIHYLCDNDIPLTEIAYCLGYSEISAFSRAFKNWTGISPLRYRQFSTELVI